MVNGYLSGSNTVRCSSVCLEPLGVTRSTMQPAAVPDNSRQGVGHTVSAASSSPLLSASAFSRSELATLLLGLSSLLQVLKRLVGYAEVVNEKADASNTRRPETPVTPVHEVEAVTPQFPHLSSMTVGERPKNVWLEFNRNNRKTDNESSIKAAMMKYGQNPRGIYSSIKNSEAGYQVIMRDGFKLTLSAHEIDRAQKRSKIWSPKDQDPEMAKDINFMNAASIKRVQLERGHESFDQALDFVEEGKDVGNGFKRLGLEAYARRTNWQALYESRGTGVVMGASSGVQFGHGGSVDCCSRPTYVVDGRNAVDIPAIQLI